MSKPIIRYIDLYNGRCGLTTDTKQQVLRRLGTENVKDVRNATEQEVGWVRSMGGHVPDGRIAKATREA